MFKIESYITPIIINHVAKYVKNIRTQDSQISLWEGEVVFQNMDLRLDVLEEELNLPFEFLSGHIHELSILVPWTRITSEPIKITINTIEFVLKLKNPTAEGAATSSAQSSPQRSNVDESQKRKRLTKQEELQAQQSMGAGLVSKIINNINVQCHNIILKYVEEDIVLSMNVQLLSFSSADEAWKSAMIDINPAKVLLRKLVQISDLTICLDKRNAAGQIDVCQEPIMYRCTLECRILRKYNASTVDTTSTTRIGIFTKAIDMNISSLQFPMAMRLVKLLLNLKTSKSKTPNVDVSESELEEQTSIAEAETSYLSWAWNLLPMFTFEPPEDEAQPDTEPIGHTLDMGVYVEELNFTLKNSEFVNENVVGATKRIRYTPIVRISLGGIYFERVAAEAQDWSSVKAGLSSIIVEPLGLSKCDYSINHALVEAQSAERNLSFIDKSLFDEQCLIADKGWGVTNYEEYSTRITEDYLLYRSPVLAFDLVEYKTKPNDRANRSVNPNCVDVETDTHVQYRLLSAGVTLRYSQTLLQVKTIITDLVESYDYPAYHAEQLDIAQTNSGPKLPPPLMEDYDALMHHIPLCTYKFDLKNMNIELYPRIEGDAKVKPRRSATQLKQSVPYFLVKFEQLEGTLKTPLQPEKLVHTTCQIPEKPKKLLDACYNDYNFVLSDFTIAFVTNTKAKLMSIPQMNVSYGSLLSPSLWRNFEIAKHKFKIVCTKFTIELSKQEIVLVMKLLNCVFNLQPHVFAKLMKQTSNPLQLDNNVKLNSNFQNFALESQQFEYHTIWYASLQKLQSDIIYTQNFNPITYSILNMFPNARAKCFESQIQIYTSNDEKQKIKTLITMWIEPYHIGIDKVLLDFLRYQEEYDEKEELELEVEMNTQYFQSQVATSSYIALQTVNNLVQSGSSINQSFARNRSQRSQVPSRKISQPEETIHISSDRDDKLDGNTSSILSKEETTIPTNWLNHIKTLVVFIDVKHGRIDVAEKLDRPENHKSATTFTRIKLPKIIVKSPLVEQIGRPQAMHMFSIPLYTESSKFTIETADLSVQIYRGKLKSYILRPVQTTITAAITYKEVKLMRKSSVWSNKGMEQDKETTSTRSSMDEDNEDYTELEPLEESLTEQRSTDHTQSNAKIKDNKATKKTKEVITLTLYADTSPINFIISTRNATPFQDSMKVFLNVFNLMQPVAQANPCHQSNEKSKIQILTANEENQNIKEFLDFETNSSKSVPLKEKGKDAIGNATTSIFCQWTIAKLILELENSDVDKRNKIILEFEDFLSTIDKSEDFVIVTNKIGNVNLNYYQPSALTDPTEWKMDECLRIKMLSEATQLPFLNIVYTTVGLNSFYQKIGAKSKGNPNRYLSEIVIKMQAIEIIMDLDRIRDFVEPLCMLFKRDTRLRSSAETKGSDDPPIIVADLPLIHLDSKGFTLYLPLESGKSCCSVVIWKIEMIKITPHLENPLQRNSVRADVYNKAAQLGFLNTPGSMIEDRQYELTVKNISAASANWDEILSRMREQANNFHRTNPAFEWNNQKQKHILIPEEIFSNFTFVGIFAPMIVYNNVVICGQAIELNCASDFVASMDLYQINLFSCMLLRLKNILCFIDETCNKSVPPPAHKMRSYSSLYLSPQSVSNASLRGTKSITVMPMSHRSGRLEPTLSTPFADAHFSSSFFDVIDENTERNVKSDSGFQSIPSRLLAANASDKFYPIGCSTSTLLERYDYTQTQVRHIPYSVSFVAGVFLFKIFEVNTTTVKFPLEERYGRIPLLSLTILQPNFMITQNMHDLVINVSIFNFNISTSNLTFSATKNSSIFPDTILETEPGESGPTGIPPPLFSLKCQRTKLQLQEVDVDIAKPIIVTLTEKTGHTLVKNLLLIYGALLENPCFDLHPQTTITRGSKIQLMRQNCFNADRLHVKCNKIVLRWKKTTHYNCRLLICDTKMNVKFLARPEKATFNFIFGSMWFQTEQKILLHPINLRVSVDFLNEMWHRLPIVIGTAKFNIIHVDLGIYCLLQLRKACKGINSLLANANTEYANFLRTRPTLSAEAMRTERLMRYKCPSANSTRKRESKRCFPREEFYQDDLRAGAFQFVETTTDTFLPLPYQIQIIKKNYGIICWRYPQPRKMCRIHVSPVPMPVSDPIHIKCRMEYYSETHDSFLPYCVFVVSETAAKDIKLPEREICAYIWRVIIMQSIISVNGECFDTSEEDEDIKTIASSNFKSSFGIEHTEPNFILHPKLLVGCMRIDTAFQAKSVPKVQFLISCNMIKLKLLNQPDESTELPNILRRYNLVNTTRTSQTFLELAMEQINFNAVFFTGKNYTVDCNLSLNVKVLDHGFLKLLYLLEQTNVQGHLRVNNLNNTAIVNVIFDKLRINFGPSIILTLLSSMAHWEEFLDSDPQRKRYAVIPKCIVINRTASRLAFGQTGTVERIALQSMECVLYSFRSDYHSQELTFFIADDLTQITEASQSVPLSLRFTGEKMKQQIRIGKNCLIIRTTKLSTTQVYVLIKGQIEFASMVPHDLGIEFKYDDKKLENVLFDYKVNSFAKVSFYRSVFRNTNIKMRLRMGEGKARGRSGDIPLHRNKNLPWLVKVPTTTNEFMSFWVRILREDIPELTTDKFQPQKVFIIIWPVFKIRSMLSGPVDMHEEETVETFTFESEGSEHVLSVPATHLSSHVLKFVFNFPTAANVHDTYSISLSRLDWQDFFWFDEQKWTIDYTLTALSKYYPIKWPFDDDEEVRVRRNTDYKAKSSIIYRERRQREFWCPLLLEISPWAIFINATELTVRISDLRDKTIVITSSNNLEMLPETQGALIVSLEYGSSWINSLPIYFDETKEMPTQSTYYKLSEKSALDIVFLRGNEIIVLLMELKLEDDRRIFRLRSKFAVANFSKTKLCVMPFAIDHKETFTLESVANRSATIMKHKIEPIEDIGESLGIALGCFHDLNVANVIRSPDSAFIYFVCLQLCNKSEISVPIPLGIPFSRRCFTILDDDVSIPLVASLIQYDGISYLTILDDKSPALLIENRTSVEFLIAETKTSDSSRHVITTPEYDGFHFKWQQRLHANTKCYYTPPNKYRSFPDMEPFEYRITLAIYKESDTVKWSKPLRIDKFTEKFVHIPGHGDVKLIICDKHRIVRMTIQYVAQQQEFSVKDLRLRLLTPDPSSFAVSKDSDSSEDSLVELPNDQPAKEPVAEIVRCAHRNNCGNKTINKWRFFVKEFVISFHTDSKATDYIKTEILNSYIDECLITYDDNDQHRLVNVLLTNVQIDNQLYSSRKYDFPVILCSENLFKHSDVLPDVYNLERICKELRERGSMIDFKLEFFDDELKIRSIACKAKPVRIYIENAFVNELHEAIADCDLSKCVLKTKREQILIELSETQALLPKDVVSQANSFADPMLLQSFSIDELHVLLSVHFTGRFYFALDHSPLTFSTFDRRQICTVPANLGYAIGAHYMSGALIGAGWVLGSIGILGSPSVLARLLTNGLRDFVSMPVAGLLRGPWAFVVGVTQGSASLLRNITAGTVNSVTTLAAAVARNLDRLTLDEEHIERTEALRRSRPQGFGEGLSQGVAGLGISLLGAVGGIARHTLEAKSTVDVVTGVGKGIVGAFTKPISGAAELVALAGQGVLYTVGFNTMPQQRQPPSESGMVSDPAAYRVWKLLPSVLTADQVLFHNKIALICLDQVQRGYVFLTASVFALIESDWEKLCFVCSIERVELSCDRDDKTLYYVQSTEEREETAEDMQYTNQRIMNFLHSSSVSRLTMTADSFDDLLHHNEFSNRRLRSIHKAFHIKEYLGEHLMQYIKLIKSENKLRK